MNYNTCNRNTSAKSSFDMNAFLTKKVKRVKPGMNEAKIIAMSVEEDRFGAHIVPVLQNKDGSNTEYADSTAYKMIVRVRAGEAIVRDDYVVDEGWMIEAFFNDLRRQLSENLGLDLNEEEYSNEEVADLAIGQPIKVWYTYSAKGYITAYWNELAYRKYGLKQDISDGIKEESEEEVNKTAAENLSF